ncbi:MAG: hypothetical protein P1U63_12865 [Coxiellaceae bacterium]|nr:hypothetical protein [Coxiellaceae bacterium]
MGWRKYSAIGVVLLLMCHSVSAIETLVLHLKRPQITVLKGLNFGAYVAGGALQAVVTPSDEGAALFEMHGEANARFQLQVVGNQIQLRNQYSNAPIKISNFRFGGNVSVDGKGRLDRFGRLNNVRLGAIAQLTRQAKPGQYNGKSIVRITYF